MNDALLERTLEEAYRRNPESYARQVLGVTWTPTQIEIAHALLKYRKVLVKASHSVGKTHLAAGLTNWFFDCFNPGICISTAPTAASLHDVLWSQIRTQRKGRAGLQPKAPRMESSPDHFACGITANDPSAFQGRHGDDVFLIYDECVGVHRDFWTAGASMMTGANTMWLAICNPTDVTSYAYEAEMSGDWHVIEVSALTHPNITAQLRGEDPPFKGAVALKDVESWLKAWCTPVMAEARRAADFEFPPGSGCWYHPGALAESRMLGRWASSQSTGF